MHLRGKKKKGSGKRTNLLTEQNLVIGDPTFDSFKANKIERNVANLGLACLCGSFLKEKIF